MVDGYDGCCKHIILHSHDLKLKFHVNLKELENKKLNKKSRKHKKIQNKLKNKRNITNKVGYIWTLIWGLEFQE